MNGTVLGFYNGKRIVSMKRKEIHVHTLVQPLDKRDLFIDSPRIDPKTKTAHIAQFLAPFNAFKLHVVVRLIEEYGFPSIYGMRWCGPCILFLCSRWNFRKACPRIMRVNRDWQHPNPASENA